MSWNGAIQVLEGLSYHVKASGNQQVIFGPKDPWILVALKALGTLEDRQVKLKWLKKSQRVILKLKTIRRLISQTHEKEDRRADWTVPGCLGDTSLWLSSEKSCWCWCGRQGWDYNHCNDCVCPCCWEIVAVFSVFVSKQRRHAGSDGWSPNTPAITAWIQQRALKWESAAPLISSVVDKFAYRVALHTALLLGSHIIIYYYYILHIFTVNWGKNTTWPRGCQWKTFKQGIQTP